MCHLQSILLPQFSRMACVAVWSWAHDRRYKLTPTVLGKSSPPKASQSAVQVVDKDKALDDVRRVAQGGVFEEELRQAPVGSSRGIDTARVDEHR